MKIVDVARQIGVHRNTVTLLYQEKAQRVELEVVNKLCRLFKCGVGDLFEFVESDIEDKKRRNGSPEGIID